MFSSRVVVERLVEITVIAIRANNLHAHCLRIILIPSRHIFGHAALRAAQHEPPNKSVNPTFTSLRFVHAGYLQR